MIAPFVLQKSPQMREFMFSGKLFSTKEAVKAGLIHFTGSAKECEVWRKDQFDGLAKLHKEAFTETKKFFNSLSYLSKKEIKSFCLQALEKRRKDSSTKERIKNFLAKDMS